MDRKAQKISRRAPAGGPSPEAGEKHRENRKPPVSAMVEDVVGCKWSLSVLRLVRDGVRRPGAMQRTVEGLSTKVLNERLRKLQRFGILEKEVFPEMPPRVEYRLTEFGRRFSAILDAIGKLQRSLDGQEP
ncbi:MAG TPA: helix-turn-helix domain-containing protein [Burkholderiales bacterium]|nr:helix-turn-helix domain-containing protein [Burkholderiales bacterium]